MSTNGDKDTAAKQELDALLEKWNDLEIPRKIEELCIQTAEPIHETIFDLVDKNIQSGIVKQTEAQSWGQETGKAMSLLSRGSVIVGIEYGSRETELSDEKIRAIAKVAFPIIHASSVPLIKLAVYLIQSLLQAKVLSDTTAGKLVDQVTDQILQASVQCFQIGAKLSQTEAVTGYSKLQEIIGRLSSHELPAKAEIEIFKSRSTIYNFFDVINPPMVGQPNDSLPPFYLQSQVHILVPKMIRSAFLIGVDYSSHLDKQELPPDALNLLEIVVAPTFRLAMELLTRGQEESSVDEKTKQILQDLYKMLMVLASECYLAGFKYK
jgi:hypothetical protein